MKLDRSEIAVACSMVELARRVLELGLPCAHRFLCYWAAFENIRTAVAARAGLRSRFELRRNGTMQTRRVGAVKVAVTHAPSEDDQVEVTVRAFDGALKRWLCAHPSTRFFAHRTPSLGAKDAFGQRLNGVIDVAGTADPRYPAWSPIDPKLYARCSAAAPSEEDRDALVRQIVDLLATVRRNVVQGGRRDDRESGGAVIEHAVALLLGIVAHFVSGDEEPELAGPGLGG